MNQKTKSEISVKQESFLTVIPRTPIMKSIYWFYTLRYVYGHKYRNRKVKFVKKCGD